jgi:hypothetical protein
MMNEENKIKEQKELREHFLEMLHSELASLTVPAGALKDTTSVIRTADLSIITERINYLFNSKF